MSRTQRVSLTKVVAVDGSAGLLLYDLVMSKKKYPGTVLASYGKLAEELGKSESSIKRATRLLEERGFIKIIQGGGENKCYLPNVFQAFCPDLASEKVI